MQEQLYTEGPATDNDFPVWTDHVAYTIADVQEASRLFGELEDDLDVAEFEAWLEGLQSTRFFEVRTAIEVVRRAIHDFHDDLNLELLFRMMS